MKNQNPFDYSSALFTRRQMIGLSGIGLLLASQSYSTFANTQIERVVSVGGILTEISYALTRQNLLVGVDLTSNYPAEARQLSQLGYLRHLSSEGIASLRPSVILALEDAGPNHVLEHLKRMGVMVHHFQTPHNVAELMAIIRRIGNILDANKEANQLMASVQEAYEAWDINNRPKFELNRVTRVMCLMSHQPGKLMVAGKDTSADRMIRMVGAKNSFSFSGFKPISTEALIAANPDVILVTDQTLRNLGNLQRVWELSGMHLTNAYQRQAIISMEAMYLLGFGPRLPKALNELTQSVYRVSLSKTS